MGCLFGAKLRPYADVILVGHWPAQLKALQRGPLCLVTADGQELPVSLAATDDLEAVGSAEIVLIVTKASKTEQAARETARILAPDGLAITLQNGLGNLEILAAQVGAERATLGVTMMGATLDGPGRLRLGGSGPTVLASRPAVADRLEAFAALLDQAGLEVTLAENVLGLVWGKLVINATINPLSALLQVPNGALIESEWARALMRQAAREVAAVAAALDITLLFEDAAAQVEQTAYRTATNFSSMLQDVLRGAETEIEAINGAVIRAAETAGVATPANRLLYGLVRAYEETRSARVDRR